MKTKSQGKISKPARRMTSLSAGYAICGALQAALGDDVTAVYPVIATENARMPFAVYYRTDSEGEPTKQNTLFDTTTIVIDIFDTDYDESVELIERARAAIEGKRFIYTDEEDRNLRIMVNCSRVEGSTEEWWTDCYRQSITVRCKIG